ncbi:MAG: hypothetical protein RLZ44_1328 [Pseudomonadota bacterium]
MMIPPRKPKSMDNTSIAELRTAIRHKVQHSREHRFLYRLFCVLLLAEGHGPQQVADWLGEHARTLERWRKRYLEKGVDGLVDETSPGRPPKLEPEQFEAVAADIAQPPYAFGFSADRWQGKLLCEHLEQRYGVQISLRQCQRLLKQLRAKTAPRKAAREAAQAETQEAERDRAAA